ncbi:hypothetical protein HN358_01920 [Candidatus Uhrbacteria bacterium]|jgi:acyl carrier protein|nr:hypothetical protein [Candidatus Uhrbacteria bacterium]MBT7716862.1 hypothetical protein [Candidatus Uhrbacteria bacterium]
MDRKQLFRIFCEVCQSLKIRGFLDPDEWSKINTSLSLASLSIDSLHFVEITFELERVHDLDFESDKINTNLTIDEFLDMVRHDQN